MINVILSGGVGSRLWPLSRSSRPKQYLPLFNNESLFQRCVRRNLSLCDSFIVVGNESNKDLSQSHLMAFPNLEYQLITEAIPRNTAASIAFAALSVPEDTVLLVSPSDHIIEHQSAYEKVVNRAEALAEEGFLVTFGIEPEYPETGYGYIEFEGETVLSFREKPNKETAVEMLQSGRFLWNSGMFCFKAGVYLNELKKISPKLYVAAVQAWEHRSDNQYLDQEALARIPSISVDYAVMEHSKHIKVVATEQLGWSDLGTFDALWTYYESQKMSAGQAENLVIGAQKPVFFVGCEDLIYVETEDAVLILPRNRSQEVKQLYERLEKERPDLIQ